ncbi:MAG: 2-C-methyl-D-erythritol 2,4-cyclodiphosphate synthase [Gammaproteobacteria bacterium]|nr:2-C-methyl-D-erythritol 2,4-cyclodiphosphate synthase [Gammaproteobacteria bacterium]
MFRIGQGFDLHRLQPGEGVTLGGVYIACDYAIVAHSDGDAAIHALCDALLGAAALGDIGHYFPDTDPEFAGADSRVLLREVVKTLAQAGFRPVNVDLTIVAQVPKLAPYIVTMRQRLCEDLGVDIGAVSVKATTHEGVDAIGEKRALSAHAVTLIAADM